MRITRRSLVASLGGLSLAPAFRVMAQDTPTGPLEPSNVFFSPAGRPYRAKMDAPYPVADWFKAADKNTDGKIDKAEFLADSVAFFDLIDRNKDGALSPQEIAFYEQRVPPEVLGYRVDLGFDGVFRPTRGAMLWRAQVHQPGPIDPGGDDHPSDAPAPKETFSESRHRRRALLLLRRARTVDGGRLPLPRVCCEGRLHHLDAGAFHDPGQEGARLSHARDPAVDTHAADDLTDAQASVTHQHPT